MPASVGRAGAAVAALEEYGARTVRWLKRAAWLVAVAVEDAAAECSADDDEAAAVLEEESLLMLEDSVLLMSEELLSLETSEEAELADDMDDTNPSKGPHKLGEPMHKNPASVMQRVHPSNTISLPSSHCSPASSTPLPH